MQISFSVRNPVTITDLAHRRDSVPEIEVAAHFYLPEGARGPVPAVVVSEGLGGLIESREFAYGRKLAAAGYAALVIDSFGSRSAADFSHPKRALFVTEAMMMADAFGGLKFLAAHPQVDAGRIHIMGFSYGGMITVLAAYEQLAALYAPGGERFAGHIAYYGCSVPRLEDPKATGAPVLIMLGELDRNVSIARTREIAGDLRRGGSEVTLKVFENNYHQWDGEDGTRRFVPFCLDRCRMRVSRDFRVYGERSGIRITNRVNRAAMLFAGVGRGYHILRDRETHKRSDEMLFDFLGRAGGKRGEGRVTPKQAAASS